MRADGATVGLFDIAGGIADSEMRFDLRGDLAKLVRGLMQLTDQFRAFYSLLAMITVLLLPANAIAADSANFTCANRAAEIRCGDGTCEIVMPEDGFTPMQLTRTDELLTLCAYSGCWSGPVALTHTDDQVTFVQARVTREAAMVAQEETTLLSILHDAKNQTAQMLWDGFANVMECGNRE